MAFVAEFAGGDPIKVEFTPVVNTNAGEVVVVSNSNTAGGVGITTQPIVANTLGAVSLSGGIYRMNCAGNNTLGTKAFWDSVLKQVVNAVGVNTINFGFFAEASVVNTISRVLHHPF